MSTADSNIAIDIRFLQLQIREAKEDLNRSMLRVQALESRMHQTTMGEVPGGGRRR